MLSPRLEQFLLSLGLVMFLSGTCTADNATDRKLCEMTGDKSPVEQRAEPCTRAIMEDRKTYKEYAESYNLSTLIEDLTNRCWVYILLGKLDLAGPDCEEALNLERQAERKFGVQASEAQAHSVYAAKGGLLSAMKKYKEALETENIAVDTINRPGSGFAYIFSNRGLTNANLGNFDDALADFQQAIRLDKKFLPAYLYRGEEYERRGDLQRAKADYERVLELPAGDFDFGREKQKSASDRLKALTGKQ